MKTITFRNETEYKKDSWYHVTIEDLIEKGILYKPMDGNHGNIHPTAKDYVESGIPFLLASDVQDDKIDLTNCKFISKKTADNLQKGFANEGDILLTHKGTVGNVALVPSIESEYVMLTPQVTYYRVRDKERLNNIFLKFMFQSEYFQNQLDVIGKGATRNYIGILAQQKLKVMIPKSIHEQKKIANILSTWDKAIELKEKLIEQKKEQKKGLMQKLLTGKIRLPGFKGEWDELPLGSIAKVIMGQSPPSESYNDLKEGYPLIQGNADCKNRVTFPRLWTSQPSKLCEIGDIIMTVRAPVGFISRSLHKACIGRGVCAIRGTIDQDYLYYQMQFKEDLWVRISQGSTFDSVNSKDVTDLKIFVPSKEEQKVIAKVFKLCEDEIGLLERDLHEIIKQKQGLMQLLLTGKVWVKV
ncbi:restriction endonuclease subunit S [Paenibacillus sp. SER-28]